MKKYLKYPIVLCSISILLEVGIFVYEIWAHNAWMAMLPFFATIWCVYSLVCILNKKPVEGSYVKINIDEKSKGKTSVYEIEHNINHEEVLNVMLFVTKELWDMEGAINEAKDILKDFQ